MVWKPQGGEGHAGRKIRGQTSDPERDEGLPGSGIDLRNQPVQVGLGPLWNVEQEG